MQVLFSIRVSKKKPGDVWSPGLKNIEIKKPWDLLEVPTVYCLYYDANLSWQARPQIIVEPPPIDQ
jgi:hypothetical protein